jgi:hypothetical protein
MVIISCCTFDFGCGCTETGGYSGVGPVAYCRDEDGDGYGNTNTSQDFCPDEIQTIMEEVHEDGSPYWLTNCHANPDADDACPCSETDYSPGGSCVTCSGQCRALIPEEEWWNVDECGVCLPPESPNWNESCRNCAGEINPGTLTKYMDNCGYCVDVNQPPDYNINQYGFCLGTGADINDLHVGVAQNNINPLIAVPISATNISDTSNIISTDYQLGNLTTEGHITTIPRGTQYNAQTEQCNNSDCARSSYDCGPIYSINGSDPHAGCVELASNEYVPLWFTTTNIFDGNTAITYSYSQNLKMYR